MQSKIRFVLHINRVLFDAIKKNAKKANQPMAQYILQTVKERMEREENS